MAVLRLAPNHCAQVVTWSRRVVLPLSVVCLLTTVAYKTITQNRSVVTNIGVQFNGTTTKSVSQEESFLQMIHYEFSEMRFDNTSNNVTGFAHPIVPDIVHYVILENPYLEFVTLLSILSVLRHHRPKLLLIHTDQRVLRGKYWDHVVTVNETESTGTTIRLNRIKRPKYIFGKRLSSVYHASDIARIGVMRRFGGIYLDNDVYVVKPLHRFLHYEFTIGWPDGQFLGTQVLVCHRNARFLELWRQSYREYRATLWYYNAGELPTTSVLDHDPSLVHRVRTEFGVHYLLPMLYHERYPFWQKDFYAVHLLARHRTHSDGIALFNEHNIRHYNRTFGEMARLAYYGTKEMLP